MSRSRYYNRFPRYVTVAEKEAKAAAALERLRKSKPELQPVTLAGKALARTWWGKGWNINLERYADYSNRIGRGRAYLRHGAVLDLVIGAGEIRALVQGSRSKPYEVVVAIKAIKAGRWEGIKKQCRGMIDALPDLLAGRFPAELAEIFMAPGAGLFPAPAEITFQCSCPDWASMCKHVAATLYGIGARLDQDPALFFKLRQVEMAELISGAIAESSSQLLARSTQKSHRIMEGDDLGALFGIELAEPVTPQTPLPPASSPAAALPAAPPVGRKGKAPSSATTKSRKAGKTWPSPTAPVRSRPGQTSGNGLTPPLSSAPPPPVSSRRTPPGRKGGRQPLPATRAKPAAGTYSKEELCAILERMLEKGKL